MLAGCTGHALDRLDARSADLIEARQRQVLGEVVEPGSQVVPQRHDTGRGDPYNKVPGTFNPPVDALPAKPGESLTMAQLSDEATATDEPRGITLDLSGALAYATEHSRDYRGRKEALFLETLDLLAENHLWGPRFFSTVSAGVSGTPERGDHDQVFELLNETGVRQRLPWGGEVSVSAVVGYVNYLRDEVGRDDQDGQTASLSVRGSIPLLRGAGAVARESLIQAHRTLVYQVRAFERFRREFFVDIASAYYDLLRQQQQIDNSERQLENLLRLSERTEALARAGRQAYIEVQRAQQEVLFARNNLLNARESYASAVDAFKITIGMPAEQPLTILASEVVVPEPALDASRAVETALAHRLDLQTVRDRVDDARRRVNNARNGLLPDLDLVADVTLPSDPDKRYAGFDIDGEGRYRAGLELDLPLDRGLEEIQLRRALVDVEQAIRQYSLERDRVALRVRSDVRRIRQAQLTLDLQNRNIEIAQTRLRGVELRQRSLSPRDVIEAQEDMLEARNRRDAAQRDLRVAILEFLLDSGQMRVDGEGQWLPPGELTSTPGVAPEATPAELLDPSVPQAKDSDAVLPPAEKPADFPPDPELDAEAGMPEPPVDPGP